MLENLLSGQSLMGVHVKHLGHQVLEATEKEFEAGCASETQSNAIS